jgi:MFS family permease
MTYAWILVALLWLVGLLNYVDRQVIFSVFPLLSAELQLSNVQLGLLSTVFLWVYGLLSPAAGWMADRFGRRRVILISLAVWSLITWATGHCQTFAQLLWARALMGISEACYIPAALALIADFHGDRSRALASGIHSSGIYAGIVLGGVGGGWMGQHFGWRLAFTVLGIFGVAYSVVLMLLLRDAPRRATAPPAPKFAPALMELSKLRGFARLTLVFCAMSMANWIAYTWLPLYLFEQFRLNLAEAGFTATFYIQAGSFTGILLGGYISDRWVLRTGQGRLFTQSAGLALAAPFLFIAAWTNSFWVVAAALALFGIGRGVFDANAMPVLCQIARPELRATGYGIYNMAGCIVGGVMAVGAGALKESTGLGIMFQVTAAVLLVSAVVLARMRVDSLQSLEGSRAVA